MTPFSSLLLGILQGLTEFLPVSSTAHLLIGQRLLGLQMDDALFSFTILVQWGTLLAVGAYFWNDLWAILKAFFRRPFSTATNRLGWHLLIATVPALIFGALLKDAVEALFRQPLLEAGIRLLLTALLLEGVEWLARRSRVLDQMTWLDALIIGLFQVLSVFPGASRSGSTIAGGMTRGLDRPSAARFAFLLSVPVMLAAGVYQLPDVLALPDLPSFLPAMAIGFVAAAVVGWLAIKWLIGYLGKHSLHVFALYCGIVGAICLTAAFLF